MKKNLKTIAFQSGLFLAFNLQVLSCSEDATQQQPEEETSITSEFSEKTEDTESNQDSKRECKKVGKTKRCECKDGTEGLKTCLPDYTFSFCVCETESTEDTEIDAGEDTDTGKKTDDTDVGSIDTQSPDAGNVVEDTETETETESEAGEVDTSEVPEYCSNLPPLPIVDFKKLDHVPAAEDFTFDAKGNFVGINSVHQLYRCPYSGTVEVLLPKVGETVRGIRFLDDDTLVFANTGKGAGTLIKIDLTDYSQETILTGMNNPNGVAIGMDGLVYLTEAGGKLHQIDPVTKTDNLLFEMQGVSLDGITFNADYTRLNFNSEVGYVSYIPFAPDGTPHEYVRLVEKLEGSSILDGMTADECGNIYVLEMNGIIWRVSSDGDVEKVFSLLDSGGSMFMCNAVNFGSGIGGWKSDALYISSLGGGVHEVVVGVKGLRQPHLP